MVAKKRELAIKEEIKKKEGYLDSFFWYKGAKAVASHQTTIPPRTNT